jgi:hypothetical protein
MFPNNDPFATVVQSTTPADVNTVMADGRFLKLDGKLLREISRCYLSRWIEH